MSTKIAIFSDLHLGVHQNNDFWLSISMRWADWFVAKLHEEGITEVFFCGDWWHYRDEISVKTLSFAKDLLDKFDGINITMITGNHDAWYKDTSEINSLSILKDHHNLTVYDRLKTVHIDGKSMTFCPWGTKVADIPHSDVVFGHFEFTNFRMNNFKICDYGDDPESILNKTDLVFSGHFHLRDEKIFNDTKKIIYVGNPFEMDFGDSQQNKGFYILNTEDLSYNFIKNTVTPKHIKLFLSNIIKRTEVEKFLTEDVSGNIIKLIIDKNINTEHLDLLVAKLLTYKPCDIRIDYDVNYNKVGLVDDDDYDLSGVDVIEAITDFINLLDIENKSEVSRYTTELFKRATDKIK